MDISSREIQDHAFFLWEKAGRPNGNDKQFWLKAELEVKTRVLYAEEDKLLQEITEAIKKVKSTKLGLTTSGYPPLYEWDYIELFTIKRNEIRMKLDLPLLELGPKYIEWLETKKKEEAEGRLLSNEKKLNQFYLEMLNETILSN